MSKKYTESRRKALRSMMAGGAAATGTGLLSKEWAKPVVDSVILPAHAQTSQVEEPPAAPPIGGFLTSASMAYSATPSLSDVNYSGSLDPSTSPATVDLPDPLADYSYNLTPTMAVEPGTTGNFNLTMVEAAFSGGDSTNYSPSSENIAALPDGNIPFSNIVAGVDNATAVTWEVTLVEDANPGSPFVMTISFN